MLTFVQTRGYLDSEYKVVTNFPRRDVSKVVYTVTSYSSSFVVSCFGSCFLGGKIQIISEKITQQRMQSRYHLLVVRHCKKGKGLCMGRSCYDENTLRVKSAAWIKELFWAR